MLRSPLIPTSPGSPVIPQEALRALCLPWDPAFLVILFHRSSLLDLLYPRVLAIPACLAFPARYLILECQENHDRVLYKFLKIKDELSVT